VTLQRHLTLRHGIPLAVGSIAGSGILFLPSVTYAIGGRDVLVIWALSIAICIPMIFMFNDMVRAVPDASGIEGFVARGLGPGVAGTVPVLFVALVSIGLPAGALIVGQYVAHALHGAHSARLVVAVAILASAVATNLVGVKTGARVQAVVTWSMIVLATALVLLTLPDWHGSGDAVVPAFDNLGAIASGVVVAFWAFAGFENLTFIAGEFKHPHRDFLVAVTAALTAYGLLTIALTISLAAVVPRHQVDELTGLLQLARSVPPAWLSTWVITVLAIALMQINATSWVWGMSRLIYAAAGKRRLPSALGRLDGRDVPRRAILFLSSLLAITTTVFMFFPGIVVEALTAASGVFIVIYVLCIVSYLRSEAITWKSVLNGVLVVFFVAVLARIGWRAVYGAVVLALAIAVSFYRAWRERRRARRVVVREAVGK
jgi:amino acid efflux transporter